jgi:hypothetical protein
MRPYHAGGVPNATGGPMMSTGAPSGPGMPVGGGQGLVPRPGQGQMVNLPHRQSPGIIAINIRLKKYFI